MSSNGGEGVDIRSLLNDKDKAELNEFIAREERLTEIQSHVNQWADICWKTCVPGSVKGAKLDRHEEACVANCVGRFIDMGFLLRRNVGEMGRAAGLDKDPNAPWNRKRG